MLYDKVTTYNIT